MSNKFKSALIGGVTLGVLSSIPFVSAVNACCCAWVLLGGALASYLYIKESPTRVTAGEGAQLGLLAGAVGGGILLLVSIPMGLLFGDAMSGLILKLFENMSPQLGEEMRRQLEIQRHMPLGARLTQIIGYSIMNAIITVIFATLGGLLGVALFEKRKGETGGGSMSAPPPPPPTDFGAPTAPFAPPTPPPAQPPAADFGGFGAETESDKNAPPDSGPAA